MKPFEYKGIEGHGLKELDPPFTGVEIIGANHVTVIDHTPNPDLIVAVAASTCYSAKKPIELYNELVNDPDRIKRVIGRCVKSGHTSVLEHASITFSLTDVSRSLLAQLSRHRIGIALSVQSQRYVSMDSKNPDDFVYPRYIGENKEVVNKLFSRKYEESLKDYEFAQSLGVKNEDARYLLPEATTTNMVMTMNLREILHFCGLRCCRCAQHEIRAVASIIARYAKGIAPICMENCGPKCEQLGYCNEGDRSCGLRPKIEDIMNVYTQTVKNED